MKSVSLGDKLTKAFEASEETGEELEHGSSQQNNIPQQQKVEEPKPKPVVQRQETYIPPKTEEKPKVESYSFTSEIPTEETIKKTLEVFSAYTRLESPTKLACHLFLSLPKETTDIPKVIFAVMNVSNSDLEGLTDLVSLRQEEAVSRAFSLMALSDNRLAKLNDLVSKFAKDFKNTDVSILDKVEYCRNLERGLSSIPEKILDHLIPLNELLLKGQ